MLEKITRTASPVNILFQYWSHFTNPASVVEVLGVLSLTAHPSEKKKPALLGLRESLDLGFHKTKVPDQPWMPELPSYVQSPLLQQQSSQRTSDLRNISFLYPLPYSDLRTPLFKVNFRDSHSFSWSSEACRRETLSACITHIPPTQLPPKISIE